MFTFFCVFQIFAIVVIGCISSQGYFYENNAHHCVYNDVTGACGYGTFVGVMAFLGLIAFLILTSFFENISNIEHRKYIVMADIGYSGL